ncbi:hypothetical protein [Streptomyces sp. NBRC 109706]|uniref:hypothetical protein n=1 Tax=Streptomyces sp. NBRC 109706 TaxID=1550035 RepID=UPI00078082D3|nr:hypothetical protein [Streptomyces sp. NBRC 109706]
MAVSEDAHDGWLPATGGPVRVRAGRWWDAIRAPLVHAWVVPEWVAHVPAIVSRRPDRLTWLVPVGCIVLADLPAAVELLRDGEDVVVPPADAYRQAAGTPPETHWTLPPLGAGGPVMDPPDALIRALRAAVGDRHAGVPA